MEKIRKFLEGYGMLIIVVMVSIMFFRTCNISREVDNVSSNVSLINKKTDSISNVIKTIPNVIQVNDDEQTAKFLYWEKQADKPSYETYTIKDYYEAIKK